MEEQLRKGEEVTPELKEMVKEESRIATEFKCKCHKYKAWISIGDISDPCPNCGRQYVGRYDKKMIGVVAENMSDEPPTFIQNIWHGIKAKLFSKKWSRK